MVPPDAFLRAWYGVPTNTSIPALVQQESGRLTYYADGVMEGVLQRRRSLFHQLDYIYLPDCLVALNDNHLGQYVVLRYGLQGEKWELCYVVDLAQVSYRSGPGVEDIWRHNGCRGALIDHRGYRECMGLVAEVDYHTWKRLGTGYVGVYLLPSRER
jgi:hypothetical protein